MARGRIIGAKALDRRIKRINRSRRKAINKGVEASMTPVAKALRAAINASDANKELKRRARKTVGRRFKRVKGNITQAKVGFGVGKRKKPQQSESGGVGISSANIHWFVLGTDERYASGKFRGHIEPVFQDATRQAFSRSKVAALAASRRKIRDTILKEARRR